MNDATPPPLSSAELAAEPPPADLEPLEAWPLAKRYGKRPVHKWIPHALHDLHCEGLNPLVIDRNRRVFAALHRGDIVRGDKFLRKLWMMTDGTELRSNHCLACGRELDAELEDKAAEQAEAELASRNADASQTIRRN